MHMEKNSLSFEKAYELLSDWNPVCYSNLITHTTVFQVPQLSHCDILDLVVFDDWFISYGFYNPYCVAIILKCP